MKLKSDKPICLDEEAKAIAAYIGLKWTPIANLEQLVQDVRAAAEHASRALFETHPVWEVATAAQDARAAMLEEKYGKGQPSLRYYDAGCQLLDNIVKGLDLTRTAALKMDGAWDYERTVDKVLAVLKPKYPELAGARPNGWAELAAGYSDFDGQEEYDSRPDRKLFQGSKMESAGSGDFVFRTALPYVMYDEKCQSRKAHYVLVGAIFSQFSLITEQQNTLKVCKDLQGVVAALPQEHVFELAVAPQTPVLKTLIKMGQPFVTRQEYDEAVAHVAAYNALSDDAKALKNKESKDSMAAFMTDLMKPRAPQSYEDHQAEQDLKIAPFKALLKEALGESGAPGADAFDTQQENEMLTFTDAIANIAEVLRQADGLQLAATYNSICSDKITYQGDSMFSRNADAGVMTFSGAIEGICEVLNGAEGDDLERTYNSICSDKVTYAGDSMFERTVEPDSEAEVLRG